VKPHYLFVLLLCLLTGCGLPLSESAIEGTPEGVCLKQTITQLATRDFAPIEAAMDPQAKPANIGAVLEQMAAIFPAGKPASIKFVGWNAREISGQDRQVSLAADYGYEGNKWLLISAEFSGEPGKLKIEALHVQPMSQSLAELNAFTFSGKGWLNYFFVMATALAFAITVYAFVLCLRTAGLRRKRLWAVFTLVGVFGFSLNWTSGDPQANLLQFNLFSAAVMRIGFVGPWFVTFSLPIGALVFLAKRKKLQATAVAQK
jgi:hypothetical protein